MSLRYDKLIDRIYILGFHGHLPLTFKNDPFGDLEVKGVFSHFLGLLERRRLSGGICVSHYD